MSMGGNTMGRHTKLAITLTEEERQVLTAWQRATTMPMGWVKRGKIVLLMAEGMSLAAIGRQVGIRRRFVEKWVKRFDAEGIAGLYDKPGRGRKPFFRSGRGRSSGSSGLSKAQRRRTESVPVG